VVGDAGLLVDTKNEPALTIALARVLGAPDERAHMAKRGLARAQEFTAERTAGRVVDLLQATVGRGPTRSPRAG